MPTKKTVQRARAAKRQGKKPTTQAGEFIREEMRKMKRGSGTARSRKQAVAIGLSEARRSGLDVRAGKRTSATTRKKASRDRAIGQGKAKPNPKRSRAAKKAARTRARRRSR
jgi:hypothetical protein